MQAKPKRVIYFRGSVHYPSSKDDDYYGYDFRESEIPAAKPAMVSKAILLEHKVGLGSIGIITRAGVDKDGSLLVNGLITDETPAGGEAIDGLYSGKYQGLSLSCLYDDVEGTDLNDHYSGLVEQIIPYEISLVADPVRETCNVHGFTDNTGNLYYFQKWDNLEQFMKDGSTTTPATQLSNTASPAEEEELDLSSSRIQFEIPPLLKERLQHRSRKDRIEMEQQPTSAAAVENAIEARVKNLAKRMRLGDNTQAIEAFFGGIESSIAEQEQEQQLKAKQIEEQFQTECLEYANEIGLSANELKGMDIGAKALVCAAIGGMKEKESTRNIKERTLKSSVQQVTNELENTKKENIEIKAKMVEMETKLNALAASKGPSAQQRTSAPGFEPPQGGAPQAPKAQASQPEAPQPGAPVQLERKSGLVPRQAPPSIFAPGSVTAAPSEKDTFKAFLKKTSGTDYKWRAPTGTQQSQAAPAN